MGLFAGSGVLHVARPSTFDAQVPDFLPAQTAVVVVSGLAELACAIGMVWPPTRRRAATAAAVLLVLVFPGNLWQSWEAWLGWQAGIDSGGYLAVTLVRLPLQAPLIRWAWSAARSGKPTAPPR